MKKSRNSDQELDGLNVSDIEWLIDYDYEPDFDLMQFDNMIYLNDEDLYHI